MGGSESKTSISSLTEAISNIAIETVQTCEVVVQQEQDITIIKSGFSWGADQSIAQSTAIKQECFSDITKQVMLQNKIIDAISQATTSSSIALLGAFGTSDATASANLTNIIRNNVTMSNIQKTYSDIKQSQRVRYEFSGISIADKLDITQGAQAFAAATIKEVEKSGVFNVIEEHIDQTAAAKQENPLDFIAKAIGAVGEVISSTTFFFIFIIAAAVLGFVLIMRSLGSADNIAPSANQPPETMSEPSADQTDNSTIMVQQPAQYAPPRYIPQNTGSSAMEKLTSAASGASIGAKIPGPPHLKAAAALAGAFRGLRS